MAIEIPSSAGKPSPKTASGPTLFLKKSTLAGVIRRGAQKMLLTPDKVKIIQDGLSTIINVDEILFLVAVGWLALPALKFQHDTFGLGRSRTKSDFQDTTLHLVFDHISQLAKLGLFVYFIDIAKVIANGMGFNVYMGDLPHALAKICYTGWIANRIAAFKRYSLARHSQQDHRNLDGQIQIFDRLIDAAIYGLALYVAVDTLQTDVGAATKSFLAFGSVGTLVVSLSMQGFVSELLHGLFLAGSNRINEGDTVEVLGMKGKIEDLGWMECTLRRSDDVCVTIPNKDLAGQRISNLSRCSLSQVKQTLRFKYDDSTFEKVPALLEDIRNEIVMCCPDLIQDGSRPLRMHMTGFIGDHIEIVIDTHYRIKPVGDAYWDNRQNALMAIGRAVKRSRLEFVAVPE